MTEAGRRKALFVSRRRVLVGSERFRRCHHREWRGAAWDCGIANGVVVSWNFFAA